MKSILVPVDFSPVSRDVVATAIRLARLTRCRLVLLYVVPPPPVFQSDFGPVFESMAPYIAALDESADRQLARLLAQVRASGVPAVSLRLDGPPGPSILAEAKKRAVRYIVLESHGHSAIYDLVLGSTASVVLRRALCPVLVVPARAQAARTSRGKR